MSKYFIAIASAIVITAISLCSVVHADKSQQPTSLEFSDVYSISDKGQVQRMRLQFQKTGQADNPEQFSGKERLVWYGFCNGQPMTVVFEVVND